MLALGELRTELNHGGFDFYFRYRRANAPIAAEAARAAGCPALGVLVEEAIALIGPDVLRLNDDSTLHERLHQLDGDFEELDRRFYLLENATDLDAALSRLTAQLHH